MRVFDLDTARDLIPVIKPIVEEISSLRSELIDSIQRIDEESDQLELMYLQTHIKDIDHNIKQLFKRIESLGGVIKGVDPILVDFLSTFQNRYIWLCWKEDEDTIMFWHELNEGFAGRKPVSLLLQKEHKV